MIYKEYQRGKECFIVSFFLPYAIRKNVEEFLTPRIKLSARKESDARRTVQKSKSKVNPNYSKVIRGPYIRVCLGKSTFPPVLLA